MVLESTPQAPELPGNPTYMTQDLQWMTTRPVTDVVRYRAESYPDFRHGPAAWPASRHGRRQNRA